MVHGNRLFLVLASSCLSMSLINAGCGGKKRILKNEGEQEALTDEENPFTVDNYVPPETFTVADYKAPADQVKILSPIASENSDISSEITSDTSLAGSAARYPKIQARDSLKLIDDKPVRFYTGFPLQIDFGLQVAGSDAAMTVNFGLIEVPPEGATDEQKAALHVCNLGSVTAEARQGEEGTDPAATQTFNASLPIPTECLKDGGPVTMMLFIAYNPDGAVQTESGENKKITVFDRDTIAQNNICFKFTRNATECQNQLYIEEAPGVNIILHEFAGESSVAVLPPEDPVSTIVDGKRLPQPFFNSLGKIELEGLSPDQDASRYTARLRYDVCLGDGDRAGITDDCDPTVGWQRLNVFDGELPEDPENSGLYQSISGFASMDPISFSAPLHVVGAVYNIFSRRGTGVWKDESNFRIRACASVYVDGVEIEQKNLESQIVDGNPKADDCIVFPVLLVEGRVDPLNRCEEAASASSLRIAESPCRQEGEGQTLVQFPDQGSHLAATQSLVNPVLSFSKGWSNGWGSRSTARLNFEVGPNLTLAPLRMVASAATKASTQGFLTIEMFNASVTASADLSGSDAHFIEPSVRAFGMKIYGSRASVPNSWSYALPVKSLGGSGKSKKVEKAQTQKIDSSNPEKPVVVVTTTSQKPNALFVREICSNVRANFAVVSVNVSACGEGGLFLSAGATGLTREPTDQEEASYPGGTRRSTMAVYFTPSIAATGRLSASLNLVIFRGGVEGSLRFIQVSAPFLVEASALNYKKTLTNGGTTSSGYGMLFDANFKSNLDISWLNGNMYVWADMRNLRWCKAWIFWYPCGFYWDRIGTRTIARFSGGSANYQLSNNKFVNYRADPYWKTSN
jgi:hypothetical protein